MAGNLELKQENFPFTETFVSKNSSIYQSHIENRLTICWYSIVHFNHSVRDKYKTRVSCNLHLPAVNLTKFHKGAYISGIKVFNRLPQSLNY
jgi:hypothetical protein